MVHRIREWLGAFLLVACGMITLSAEKCLAQDREEGQADQRARLLGGVEQAVEALRALDRPEDAQHLARVLESLSRGARDPERREHAENPELRAARQQLEVLHLAMEVLAAADRGDAANQVEQAIHALNLAIEGRRDAAQTARRNAPGRGALAELLMLAAQLLEERGQGERAQVVSEYANRLARFDRPREEGRERPEGDAPRRREREERPSAEQRLDRLEARVEEVVQVLEQIQAELRERK